MVIEIADDAVKTGDLELGVDRRGRPGRNGFDSGDTSAARSGDLEVVAQSAAVHERDRQRLSGRRAGGQAVVAILGGRERYLDPCS